MRAGFISPNDSRWRDFLANVDHDIYHLPEYISLAARHEGGKAVAFFADTSNGALLIPLLMRQLPESLLSGSDFCDVMTPYGYPSPVLGGNPSEGTVTSMLEAFIQVGREKGVISAFWRLHPLLHFPLAPLVKVGQLVQHGRTVYIDLSRTPDQFWSETSNNHRRHIKSLQKNGFVAVLNEWKYWDSFLEIYRDSMNRVEADDFYFFSNDYFSDLRSTLGNRISLWTVLSPQGEVAAAALWTCEAGIVQYHLGGTDCRFLELSPMKLIIFRAQLWAREAGHRLMHLGGGVGGKPDSLFTFKSRFSPLTAEFYTFRAVFHKNIYNQLILRRFGEKNTKEIRGETDYFPAYRTPSLLIENDKGRTKIGKEMM